MATFFIQGAASPVPSPTAEAASPAAEETVSTHIPRRSWKRPAARSRRASHADSAVASARTANCSLGRSKRRRSLITISVEKDSCARAPPRRDGRSIVRPAHWRTPSLPAWPLHQFRTQSRSPAEPLGPLLPTRLRQTSQAKVGRELAPGNAGGQFLGGLCGSVAAAVPIQVGLHRGP